MFNKGLIIGIASLVAVISTPALAHHSTAGYDPTHQKTLVGTVKKFYWTNPHMFIYLLVDDGKGGTEEWTVECGTPNINIRNGWKVDIIKPGDKITVLMNPARNGTMDGQADTVTLADGRKLLSPGHDTAAQARH